MVSSEIQTQMRTINAWIDLWENNGRTLSNVLIVKFFQKIF